MGSGDFLRLRLLSAWLTSGELSTGLGLAFVHDLVFHDAGRIWAEAAEKAVSS